MKELIDYSEVPARGYYYLLDWNERDERKTITRLFNTNKLCELELSQYITLFEFATKRDIEELKIK